MKQLLIMFLLIGGAVSGQVTLPDGAFQTSLVNAESATQWNGPFKVNQFNADGDGFYQVSPRWDFGHCIENEVDEKYYSYSATQEAFRTWDPDNNSVTLYKVLNSGVVANLSVEEDSFFFLDGSEAELPGDTRTSCTSRLREAHSQPADAGAIPDGDTQAFQFAFGVEGTLPADVIVTFRDLETGRLVPIRDARSGGDFVGNLVYRTSPGDNRFIGVEAPRLSNTIGGQYSVRLRTEENGVVVSEYTRESPIGRHGIEVLEVGYNSLLYKASSISRNAPSSNIDVYYNNRFPGGDVAFPAFKGAVGNLRTEVVKTWGGNRSGIYKLHFDSLEDYETIRLRASKGEVNTAASSSEPGRYYLNGVAIDVTWFTELIPAGDSDQLRHAGYLTSYSADYKLTYPPGWDVTATNLNIDLHATHGRLIASDLFSQVEFKPHHFLNGGRGSIHVCCHDTVGQPRPGTRTVVGAPPGISNVVSSKNSRNETELTFSLTYEFDGNIADDVFNYDITSTNRGRAYDIRIDQDVDGGSHPVVSAAYSGRFTFAPATWRKRNESEVAFRTRRTRWQQHQGASYSIH